MNLATTQSPVCVGYEGASHLAVDGNITTEFGQSKPHACTCARGTSSTFWSVDLGKPYPLHNIIIFQTNSNHHRLIGLSIFVDESRCYQWKSSPGPPTVFNITCDKTGQIVKFQVPRQEYLTLCEVQIFVCADGYWGQSCSNICGNCRIGTSCNKQDGSCTCQIGWAPPKCTCTYLLSLHNL
ncbi:uncharacterized protein LOC121378800 [Gigantopelta aegis]|uniref:uncharacterized protein LOC121378800 n=1 Tax=Gigantopelta aegis TaxID=1735272 RepID=UPI001B887F0D|nr:uncharacterized protein LOC121378800 [Gigantopelta aegis]